MALRAATVSSATVAAAQAEAVRKAAELVSAAQRKTTADLAEKAPIDSPEFTGTVVLPVDTSIGLVSDAEISFLNGVSSPIQDQINDKESISDLTEISTDAALTFTPTVSKSQVFHTGALTTARTITLGTVGVSTGWSIRFTRTGSGAFNLSIGSLKNLTTSTWCDVIYNGSAWVLTAYGAL